MSTKLKHWMIVCTILLMLFPSSGSIEAKRSSPGAPGTEDTAPTSTESSEKPLNLAELQRKYSETFVFRGPRVKQVALTFDDVPDPRFTPQVLKILKREGVKATFFVVGSRAKKHPDLVRQIHRDGHIIGNHSYTHNQFKKHSMQEFQSEILRTEKVIQNIVGYRPKLIRPPYGDINEAQVRWAKRHSYRVVNWNVDSLDWKGLDKDKVKQNVLETVGPGSIVLQHAGGGSGSNLNGTIEALPEIIEQLKSKGYQFVNVADMLQTKKNKL
ncbi:MULTISPECIES: polysaccharide deacetylase family protein [unclassified Paenibacillus]|uniref:polysaccharide deacetylase family protein n=1 Tax=unclassified Paenibacillus TaxID=185978 RepID=UPI000838D8B6|nr:MULTISPECIES: polysaccharide deacetylase family protein [unclassified Paenibacillus]